MAEEQVVDAGQDGAGTPQASAPSAPPAATPPATPDVETLVAQRLETERRKWQSSKDRELAELQRQARQREAALRETAKAHLAQAGQDPEGFDRLMDNQSKIAFAEQVIREQQEIAQSRAQAQDILDALGADEYGLSVDDPRLQGLGNWENYRATVKSLVRAAERQAREAEKAAAEQRAVRQVDERIASGQLSTVSGGGAAPADHQAEKDQLWEKLDRALLEGQPRDAILKRLRDLGEEV